MLFKKKKKHRESDTSHLRTKYLYVYSQKEPWIAWLRRRIYESQHRETVSTLKFQCPRGVFLVQPIHVNLEPRVIAVFGNYMVSATVSPKKKGATSRGKKCFSIKQRHRVYCQRFETTPSISGIHFEIQMWWLYTCTLKPCHPAHTCKYGHPNR